MDMSLKLLKDGDLTGIEVHRIRKLNGIILRILA